MAYPRKINWRPGPLFADFWGPVGDSVWRRKIQKGRSVPVRRTRHRRQQRKSKYDTCPCEAFKMCDLIYQNLPFTQKTLWKISVKKPQMSGYELFMKECVSAAIQYQCEAASPSCSGGYSCRHLNLGDPLTWENFVGHAPPEEDSWEPGVNECNSCDPALPDTVYWVGSDFGGQFAAANGDTTLAWFAACNWLGVGATNFRLVWNGSIWYVQFIFATVNCSINLTCPPGNDPCNPFGNYNNISYCSDWPRFCGNSCSQSSSASVTIDWRP